MINFRHVASAPSPVDELPDVGRLRDFYETFGSLLLYHDDQSGDAGKYVATPAQWADLQDHFGGWVEPLDEEERTEILPDWISDCQVIGETPRSGNYILMPTQGQKTGRVFEFDHDGFEFSEVASDLVEYVQQLLDLDARRLTEKLSKNPSPCGRGAGVRVVFQ